MANVWTPDEFFSNLVKGYHGDMTGSGTFKVALALTLPATPKSSVSVLGDITQIAATGGYTTGGNTIALDWAETGAGTGIWQLGDTTNLTFTPSGTYPDFRYAVLYQTNTTTITSGVVAVLDYGSTVTGLTGDFIIDPGTSGWIQYTTPAWA